MSSIVAEILLAPIYKALPEVGVAIGYADNTLLMAKTQKDAVTITEAFWSACKAHPVGLLELKQEGAFKPGQPVDFLGYRLTPIKGEVKIESDPENLYIFERKVKKGIRLLRKPKLPPASRLRIAKNLKLFVISWTASFALCDGIADRRAWWLSKIQSAWDHGHK